MRWVAPGAYPSYKFDVITELVKTHPTALLAADSEDGRRNCAATLAFLRDIKWRARQFTRERQPTQMTELTTRSWSVRCGTEEILKIQVRRETFVTAMNVERRWLACSATAVGWSLLPVPLIDKCGADWPFLLFKRGRCHESSSQEGERSVVADRCRASSQRGASLWCRRTRRQS